MEEKSEKKFEEQLVWELRRQEVLNRSKEQKEKQEKND
jgi:hypothetical protein